MLAIDNLMLQWKLSQLELDLYTLTSNVHLEYSQPRISIDF